MVANRLGLNANQLKKKSGLTNIYKYQKEGLIKPIGYAISSGIGGISGYYHPRQIIELKKNLGITLDVTKGLLSESQFENEFGSHHIEKYRKKGLIKPVGYGVFVSTICPFYHPRQISELKKKLGITLDVTKGLLSESQFGKEFGSYSIGVYRKKGLINPIGFGIIKGKIIACYHPRQIIELKKKLGITLNNKRGLLCEWEFAKLFGSLQIRKYRMKGLIKPVGYSRSPQFGLAAYYYPKQIKELRKKLGITLDDTKGLLSENQFRKKFRSSRIGEYRIKRLIIPIGYALARGEVSPYYHPRQISELKKKLGITLDDTKGLLNEKKIKIEHGLHFINKYRIDGLIKPIGYAMSCTSAGFTPFYHPRQIKELKAKLQKIAASKSKQ